MKKALILDLDNTIYPVSAIQGQLFGELFNLIDEAPHLDKSDKVNARYELTRRPYHLVADQFNFGAILKAKGNNLLQDITYNLPIKPFEDYHYIRSAPFTKFLVTTGFTKLQWSKVKMLGIEADFEEIHIVDPMRSTQTKKEVFADILNRYHYIPNDVLVIGDDPESEIKAAIELGIDTFLFDPENKHPNAAVTFKAANLMEVVNILS